MVPPSAPRDPAAPAVTRPLLVDTDMGVDDTAALIYLAAHIPSRLLAVTTTYGNVPVEQATANALYVLDRLGLDAVPVHPGCAAPLIAVPIRAPEVHGPDGLGGNDFPPAARTPASETAVEAILRLSRQHSGQLDVVTLGPLTNLAVAIAQDRDLPGRLHSVVVMGGTTDGVGNTTAAAEFNIANDPEAGRIVFASGVPLTMVGYDACRQAATFSRADLLRIARASTDQARFLTSITGPLEEFSRTVIGIDGYDLPDALAAAVAADDTLITNGPPLFVTVETDGTHTRGMTVVDHLGVERRPPNARVVLRADEDRFKTAFFASLEQPRSRPQAAAGPS